MKTTIRAILAAALVAAATLPLAGCETNPATGRQIITLGSSIEDDARIGAQEHPKIVKEFGGVYDDPELNAYVAIVASKLAAASELPGIEWRFTVLNSKELNAFALPGGYVYVTRGLLALAGSEAELAGVLAHEIGHVTARHSAERQGDATLAGGVSILAAILLGDAGGQIANTIGSGYVQHYSQSQEFEADTLGVRYLSRTGYDVRAMASFLAKMRAHSQLENKIAGRPESAVDQGDFFASHPRTIDRVERAAQTAVGAQGSGTALNRETYLKRIDGVLFGDDAEQGFIRGRRFVHPRLRFQFEAPDGFRMINTPAAVLGLGPNGARFKFDMDTQPEVRGATAVDYLRRDWAAKAQLSGLERLQVNGLDGATARVAVNIDGQAGEGRLVAIKADDNRFYRFIMANRPADATRLSEGFRRLTYSPRRLSAEEAGQIKPQRIQVRQVRAGETVASLAAQMSLEEHREDWLRVLNGLAPGEQVRAGQTVKLVRE